MAAAVQNLYADDYRKPMPEVSNSAGAVVRPFSFNLALQTNPLLSATSTIKLVQIPGAMGIVLLGYVFDVPDMDTSTNLVFQLGDSTAADTFLTTTLFGTIGQAAGRVNSAGAATAGSNTVLGGCVLGVLPKTYTSNDDLILTVQAGPTTATTGIIKGYITYVQTGVGPAYF